MIVVSLPRYFHLNNSSKETIKALAELIKYSNKTIYIDFSKIEFLTKGDAMVFWAQIEKSFYQGNRFYREGKLPASKRIRDILEYDNKVVHEDRLLTNIDFTNTDKEKLINPNLIDKYVRELRKIGIKDYYYPFNTFLTEIIGNAVEHGIENKKINWWLTHEIDRGAKLIKYTFVDMGLGIVQSHQRAGLPYQYFILGSKSIVLDALIGKLGSSTKKANRGLGLPQLREMIEKEVVSNLCLITNRVCLRYINTQFVADSNPDFVGTYYSWTIDLNNFNKWKNSK